MVAGTTHFLSSAMRCTHASTKTSMPKQATWHFWGGLIGLLAYAFSGALLQERWTLPARRLLAQLHRPRWQVTAPQIE
jgi:hypothetical protein